MCYVIVCEREKESVFVNLCVCGETKRSSHNPTFSQSGIRGTLYECECNVRSFKKSVMFVLHKKKISDSGCHNSSNFVTFSRI